MINGKFDCKMTTKQGIFAYKLFCERVNMLFLTTGQVYRYTKTVNKTEKSCS